MKKRIVYTILLVLWMGVIFMFSNANQKTSQKTSDNVTKTVIDTTTKITKKKITPKEKEKMVDDYRVIIRKTAHFTLYLVLGVLTFLTFRSYNISNKLIIYSILFCFIYAISDEVHQLFSTGRSFEITDILIDTFGSSVGVLIISRFKK